SIIVRHLLPNVTPILLVQASLTIPGVILTEAIISFLGLGVQVPTPSWGNMLDEAQRFYRTNWLNVFIPGFMIYVSALCLYLVGIGLRDALDPNLGDCPPLTATAYASSPHTTTSSTATPSASASFRTVPSGTSCHPDSSAAIVSASIRERSA